jgi:hypothetical protein
MTFEEIKNKLTSEEQRCKPTFHPSTQNIDKIARVYRISNKQ